MTISVATISKYETFTFSAQYVLKQNLITVEPIDPMVQLFFYSLLDELYIKISKQKQDDSQDYYFPSFAFNNNQKISIFLSYSGNFFFVSIPEEISVNDELIKQFFIQFLKIYAVELMNPFYRDGAPIASETLMIDIGQAVLSMINK